MLVLCVVFRWRRRVYAEFGGLSTGKHHGRIRGNGNNNNDNSGNPLYANENVSNVDHQLRDPYHQNYSRGGGHKPDCPCLGCHGGRMAHQSLLQPPPSHSSPRERGETQQQGAPISHTISNTTMSTVRKTYNTSYTMKYCLHNVKLFSIFEIYQNYC